MKRFFAFVNLLIASVAPLVALAKGELVRIEITGPTLPATLVVADSRIFRQLFIWSGPGAGQAMGSPQSVDSGSFIDWHEGIAEHVPEGMASYDVSFYCAFDDQQPDGRLTYAVKYAYDATTKRSYT